MRLTVTIILLNFFFLIAAQDRVPEADSILVWAPQYLSADEWKEAEFFFTVDWYEGCNSEQKELFNEIYFVLWEELKLELEKQKESEELTLYPNPTADIVHIDGAWQKAQHLYAIDARGKQTAIDLGLIQDGDLPLTTLKSGKYLLLFQFEDKQLTRRIIKH